MNIIQAYVFDWIDMPQDIKDEVAEWYNFSNDCYLEFYCEIDYSKKILHEEIEDWWQEDLATGDWNEDEFKEWLWDNGTTDLTVANWIANQIGQAMPNLILIKVDW